MYLLNPSRTEEVKLSQQATLAAPELQFLRQVDVLSRTKLSRSTLYELIAKGDFPKPLKLGERINAWSETEITEWQQAQLAARSGG